MQNNIIRLHERQIESLETLGFAVQCFERYRATGNTTVHGHDILEMNLIVAGTAYHRIGAVRRTCPPGTLGIVHYGQEHTLTTEGTGIDIINIYLDPANHPLPVLPTEFSTIISALFPPAVLPGMPAGLCSFLHFDDVAPLAALLRYCSVEQEAMGPGYKTALESALTIFLIACARQAMAEGIETVAADHSRWSVLEGLRLKLDREFAAAHRLADLANTVNMSEAHLCRRFKAYTGLSPFAYLAQCRIRAAMQELRNSNRKVLDIAFDVGFNDIGHFNRKFRQLAGCSPSQYRRGRP